MNASTLATADAATLSLIKLCVGIEEPAHLARVQERRLRESDEAGQGRRLVHITRNTPRRSAELLDGGSLYWVIKGRIRVRQRLLGIETDNDADGKRICRLVLDPLLIETEAWRCRAFQGWRYLLPENAPPDARTERTDFPLPGALAAELRELGLL
jgi:hypothetical protein